MKPECEIEINGDQIWGLISIDGKRHGRGMVLPGRLDEATAMQAIYFLREAVTENKIRERLVISNEA